MICIVPERIWPPGQFVWLVWSLHAMLGCCLPRRFKEGSGTIIGVVARIAEAHNLNTIRCAFLFKLITFFFLRKQTIVGKQIPSSTSFAFNKTFYLCTGIYWKSLRWIIDKSVQHVIGLHVTVSKIILNEPKRNTFLQEKTIDHNDVSVLWHCCFNTFGGVCQQSFITWHKFYVCLTVKLMSAVISLYKSL